MTQEINDKFFFIWDINDPRARIGDIVRTRPWVEGIDYINGESKIINENEEINYERLGKNCS